MAEPKTAHFFNVKAILAMVPDCRRKKLCHAEKAIVIAKENMHRCSIPPRSIRAVAREKKTHVLSLLSSHKRSAKYSNSGNRNMGWNAPMSVSVSMAMLEPENIYITPAITAQNLDLMSLSTKRYVNNPARANLT